jgi:glycosyltransferase involved in cell wall biosynthesis
MNPLSVVILAKNEELFIERCICSVQWADEVLVLDSGSTDKTREIAKSLGAVVYEQEWLGWTEQHNKAIELAKHDWILTLDCDEIVTPQLATSIKTVLHHPMKEQDGYSMSRRGDFYDVLLPDSSPRHRRLNFIRLFNRKFSGYDPSLKVHEEVRVSGRAIPLNGYLIHWRGYLMDEYITSANRYATIEAEALNEKGVQATWFIIIFRPILRFIWCYFLHRECLLGTKGLIHSLLAASREYIRYTKLWEMQKVVRTIHPPNSIFSTTYKVEEDSLKATSLFQENYK